MEIAVQLTRVISRQFSTGSVRMSGRFSFKRQNSLDPRRNNRRFSFGRQSSLDPICRSAAQDELSVPENLDSTMQLLFMACRGDVKGVQDLLDDGIDVNSIDLDGRTALHIAACEGHLEVVKLLVNRRVNINARDRWGSTTIVASVIEAEMCPGLVRFSANPKPIVAAADAKYYGNVEVYNTLKAHGTKIPKFRKTPMAVANPREVPEYELNPLELQIRRSDGITKGTYQVAKWNGTKVAVKILDKDSHSDPASINAFKHELTLLEKVRHPNVVQFVGAVTQNLPMMIVSEYHSKGDLGNYLQKKGRLSPSRALKFALDIARHVSGFGLISLSKVSPGRAKLLQPDAQIDCSTNDFIEVEALVDQAFTNAIVSFGALSAWVKALLTEFGGLYVAPEVYKNEIFDRSVDAYSFGLILYEMVEGVQPFHPRSPEDAAKLMCLEGKRPTFKTKSKYYPPDLKDKMPRSFHESEIVPERLLNWKQGSEKRLRSP
ncbi:hypothetical protein TEA_027798 [Camellia sinensis var. sinensis]|uniref:Protein kinase domain-containing protein n=1 Tax=Camellia sinensis var. sinensis TaxID=542762 RepID=A0A4S4EEM5_CAMSN|nr:hypothetical protein TEA_027798 [Camellia sinensis var. sinensis]